MLCPVSAATRANWTRVGHGRSWHSRDESAIVGLTAAGTVLECCQRADWHSPTESADQQRAARDFLRNNPRVEAYMKLKPLGDRLIVKAVEEDEVTSSGIVLPDTAKEKPQKGEVVAVGDGKWDDEGDKRIP